jgi:phytoene synthase
VREEGPGALPHGSGFSEHRVSAETFAAETVDLARSSGIGTSRFLRSQQAETEDVIRIRSRQTLRDGLMNRIDVEASYREAERITRAEAKNFFYAFRFLPPHKRRAIYAVYAFSRRCDDAVDAVEESGKDPAEARADLAFLSSFLGESAPQDPLAPALRDTLQGFSIPRQPLDELIAGMEMDLTQKQYATFEDLQLYCYRAASVVGLVCIEIFGYTDPAASPLAEKLGLAMQLTNILRDIKEDIERDRIYLPADELARFDCTHEELRRGEVTSHFRELMKFQIERTRSLFAEASALFPLIDADARYCPVLLKEFYSRILDVIEARDYDVFSRRPRLSRAEKLRLAGSLWVRSRAARWRASRQAAKKPVSHEQ